MKSSTAIKVLLLSLLAIIGIVLGGNGEVYRDNSLNEQCILCHVDSYNAALNRSFMHQPFLEKNCSICHLSGNAQTQGATTGSSEYEEITGRLVDQAPAWRKQLVFGGEHSSIAHEVVVNNLDPQIAYRFRMTVSESHDGVFVDGVWLGLRTSELSAGESRFVAPEQFGEQGQDITSIMITSLSLNDVMISWDTSEPVYSRLELQEIELSNDDTSIAEVDSSPSHPELKQPENLSIDACYQCHPESELGTSHPVKLYSGKDVKIPDELPTVDGMLTCVTCHDPHASSGEMLVREIIKTKLCVSCHYRFKNSSPSTMFR